jgi:hypothetical protein
MLYVLSISSSLILWVRKAEHVALMAQIKNVYTILVGKPSGTPKYRWVDCIKMDLRETGFGTVDRIELAQDMVQWQTFMNVMVNLSIS